jgi:phage terminase large subunit
MTPQDKAKELLDKYCFAIKTDVTDSGYFTNIVYAKECAIIAVDEIIAISSLTKIVYTESTNNSISEYTEHYYWQQVKEEINKL